MCTTGVTDRLLHMLTEERDEKVISSVISTFQTLSKSYSKQIVQCMIHYKQQNSVIKIYMSTYT